MLYRLAVDTGKFEIIKDSVGGLTDDRRLQAMFIAFSFGAFIEGAAGFGAPVAVSGAMLAGLGFSSVLRGRHLPAGEHGAGGVRIDRHSRHDARERDRAAGDGAQRDGRPAVRDDLHHHPRLPDRRDDGIGRRALEVLPAIIACGVSFAGMQFYVSNYVGPELTDIMSSLTCIVVMVFVLKLWKPKTILRLEGDKPASLHVKQHSAGEMFMAWSAVPAARRVRAAVGRRGHQAEDQSFRRRPAPRRPADRARNRARLATRLMVPGLHNQITQMPPVTKQPAPYAALFELNWLSASGTACFLAAIATALVLRVRPGEFVEDVRRDVQAAVAGDADHRVRCWAWRT